MLGNGIGENQPASVPEAQLASNEGECMSYLESAVSQVRLRWAALTLVGLLLPTTAVAQSAISGLVTDSSGAVLPGVTVEAKSPALIEGARTAISGDEGQYRITDLRPGDYTVTFTLQGFNTVAREGIRLE